MRTYTAEREQVEKAELVLVAALGTVLNNVADLDTRDAIQRAIWKVEDVCDAVLGELRYAEARHADRH